MSGSEDSDSTIYSLLCFSLLLLPSVFVDCDETPTEQAAKTSGYLGHLAPMETWFCWG